MIGNIKIEYPGQRIYFYDNIPSHLAGEWSGIKSSRFNGSIKIINQIRSASFKNPNPMLPLLGRRHYIEKRGNEINLNPTKKLIFYEEKEEKAKGIKIIPRRVTEEKQFKMNITISPIRKNKLIDLHDLKIKRPYPQIYNLTNKESKVEDLMKKKKRLFNIFEKRNNLGLKSNGDKIYKYSEYSDNFFKSGGLIIGSTNKINYNKTESKRNCNFYDTIDLSIETLNPLKLWKNKQNEEYLNSQKEYVKNLLKWEVNTLGSIDNKTGLSNKIEDKKKK